MSVIQLDSLKVQLGSRTVLDGLTCELHGKSIGLLGPNGAGKSTLINTLLGFHTPSSGTARVLGLDVRSDGARIRQGIGYMPENDSFIGNMTGVRFVRYMAELAGLPANQALERAHEALFYVGLGEVRYRKVSTYSLGMKQLIKLAQALVHGPQLLVLDEPTNGLDPIARQRMIHTLQEIRKEGSIRLLISSHLLRDIDETCEEVLILKGGRVAALCNIEEERRSHRNFIELDAIGPSDQFCETLRGLGCECAVFAGGRVKLVMPDRIEVRDLYVMAGESGMQIRRIHRRRDSLEDIFMRAMEDEQARGNLSTYNHDYRAYAGELTPLRARVRVVVRYALEEAWSSRVTVVLLVFSMLPVLVYMFGIYLANNSLARALIMRGSPALAVNASYFLMLLSTQCWLALVMTAWIAPRLISFDLADNALAILLSHPISRFGYVFGKFVALFLSLSLVTWVPCLLLFAYQGYSSALPWAAANLRIAAGLLVGSLLWIVLLSILGLALSSWVKWRAVATGVIFAAVLVPAGIGGVVTAILRTKWGFLLNVPVMMTQLWQLLLGAERMTPDGVQLPSAAIVTVLVITCVVCVAMLNARIRAREVVRG